jgi:uncharacterized membrane protein YvbJ
MLICPQCHKKNKDSHKVCSQCGYRFPIKVNGRSTKGKSEPDPLHRTHTDPITGKPWKWG